VSNNPVDWVQQSREYVNEVQVEFKKVTWPSQKEAVAGTASVLFVVAIIGVALFAVDSVLAWIMSMLLP
jgi:preprotein translocase subunit SecE